MAEVTVFLNINDDPQVSCQPPQCVVDNGNHDITWKHGGNESFTFVSIDDLPSPTFTTPHADDPDHPEWFICNDNNQQQSTSVYVVWVRGSDGQLHSTNKTAGGGGGGEPSIKNN